MDYDEHDVSTSENGTDEATIQVESNGENFNVDIVEDAMHLLSRPTTGGMSRATAGGVSNPTASGMSRPTVGGKQPRKVNHPSQAPSKQPRKYAGNRVVSTQLNVFPAAECQRCIVLETNSNSNATTGAG